VLKLMCTFNTRTSGSKGKVVPVQDMKAYSGSRRTTLPILNHAAR